MEVPSGLASRRGFRQTGPGRFPQSSGVGLDRACCRSRPGDPSGTSLPPFWNHLPGPGAAPESLLPDRPAGKGAAPVHTPARRRSCPEAAGCRFSRLVPGVARSGPIAPGCGQWRVCPE